MIKILNIRLEEHVEEFNQGLRLMVRTANKKLYIDIFISNYSLCYWKILTHFSP